MTMSRRHRPIRAHHRRVSRMTIPRPGSILVALGWLVGLWSSSAGPPAGAGGRAEPAPPAAQGRCVVLVSLDGFAQFSLDDPKSDIPTLRRMAREGAVADGG